MSNDEVSTFAYLIRTIFHFFSQTKEKGAAQPPVTIITFTGIMAEIVVNHERPEPPEPFQKLCPHLLEIRWVMGSITCIDINLRSVALDRVIITETDMKHLRIISEDRPRTISMMAIRIEDRKPPVANEIPDMSHRRPCTGKIRPTPGGCRFCMVTCRNSEDKGIRDLPLCNLL